VGGNHIGRTRGFSLCNTGNTVNPAELSA